MCVNCDQSDHEWKSLVANPGRGKDLAVSINKIAGQATSKGLLLLARELKSLARGIEHTAKHAAEAIECPKCKAMVHGSWVNHRTPDHSDLCTWSPGKTTA